MNNNRSNSDHALWASQDQESNSPNPIEYWWKSAAVTPKDLLDKAENWSLAADAATATILESLSKKIILHTQEVVTSLSTVHENSEKLNAAVQNTNTEFHLLSNIQFIENRTYQDNDNLADDDDRPQRKSDPTPEEILSSYKRALQAGVELVNSTIKRYEISDSDSDSESPARPLTVFKRIDSYGDRKLPLIIGSEEFHKDETLGLFDPSEKGASSIPASSESEVDDEKMKSHTGYNIKGISSKILEDESDSDVDIPSNAGAITSKQSHDSSYPVFTPAAAVLGMAANGKNDLSPPFRGLLSDSEDDGPLIFAPDAIRTSRNISTPNEAKPNALFDEVSPNPYEKQRKDNKSFNIINESTRNIITADDSNGEDSLFYSKSNCAMVPGSKVLLPQNSSKRTKPSRKLRKKKGLFDSSSSSSAEETGSSNITTLENGIIPDYSASCSKKPVGGINIFNAAITKAIQSQKHDDSSAKEHTNISSSENSSSPSISVKKRIVKKVTDQAMSSSVRSKSSHTSSGIEAIKVPKPVRHNSLFSDEEDLFAPVPVQKSHTSGNPISLFDDSDDDLFGAPSKVNNVISTNSNVRQSNSKTNYTPQVALSQSKKKNSEPKETNENEKFSVKPKVYEINKPTPRIKNHSRKTAKNIFMSSSSGDEDIFTPPPLPKTESQRNSFLPSALDAQGEKRVKTSSDDEDDLFGPPPLPTPNVKQQLPELPKYNIESNSCDKNPLKDKNSIKKSLPNLSKKNDFDALQKETTKTNVQQDNKNLKHHKTNANPFSSSSEDDIFNFSISKQNKGQLISTSKTDKENDVSFAAPKSYKMSNSSTIDVQTKSQDLSNSPNLVNSSQSGDSHIIQSQPFFSVSSKPYENSMNSTTNLEIRKPVTIFDDDSDEDIFAIDFACRTTHIDSNEKRNADFQIQSDVISSDTLIGRSKNDVVPSAVEKPCITDYKSGEATNFDSVLSLTNPSQDTFIDVAARKPQQQDRDSLAKQIKKISSEDFSIFVDEDSDDIFSSKSTGKVCTKKIDNGNKPRSDAKSSLTVTTSGITKETISSYDEDDIFSSSLPCHCPINSLCEDAKSALFNSSNQNTLASKQYTDHPTQDPAPDKQSISGNKDNVTDPPADLAPENEALPNAFSTKKLPVTQTYHNTSHDSKMVTEVSVSDDKLKKIPPKVSQKPAIPKTEKTLKGQVEPSAADGSGGKSSKRSEQLSDSKLNKPKMLPVVSSNIDNKSPKKPVGGVALYGGNELLAKITKRQESEDISEHECTSPNFKENISDNNKTIRNNLEKHSGIQTPIQSSVARVPPFSKIDSKCSGETHQRVICLEKGSSFDDSPASSTSVLKSMNKDRPRIKQHRNPPSRSRKKSIKDASKEINDNNYINDLPKLANDGNGDFANDIKPISGSGAHNSTLFDIFGNDDDDDLFSSDQSTKEEIKSNENIVASKPVSDANEIVTTVEHSFKTEENAIVPKHYSSNQTEKPASLSRDIEDKGSGLRFPDKTQPKEQQFDSKTKKAIEDEGSDLRFTDKTQPKEQQFDSKTKKAIEDEGSGLRFLDITQPKVQQFDSKTKKVIEDEGTGLRFPDKTQPKEQQFDSKTKKAIEDEGSGLRFPDKTQPKEQQFDSKSKKIIEHKGSGLRFSDKTQPKEQLFDSKLKKTILKSSNLFGDDDDEDDVLFGGSLSTEKIKVVAVVTSKPNLITSKKKMSLFSDDEDEDPAFDTKRKMSQQKKDIDSKTNLRQMAKKTSLFSDDESEDLFNSSSIDRKESKKESKSAFQQNKPGGETSKKKKNNFCNDPLMGGQT